MSVIADGSRTEGSGCEAARITFVKAKFCRTAESFGDKFKLCPVNGTPVGAGGHPRSAGLNAVKPLKPAQVLSTPSGTPSVHEL